jgi:hypothetical protein
MNGIRDVQDATTEACTVWAVLGGPWFREDEAGLSGLMKRTAGFCGRWDGNRILIKAAKACTGMLC